MFLGAPRWMWAVSAVLGVIVLITSSSGGVPGYSNSEIASIARTKYGRDCPSVSTVTEIQSQLSSRYRIACTNGTRFTVYLNSNDPYPYIMD